MLNLKQIRSKEAGTPDLFTYAALIDEGIVLGKDGSLLAGFLFRGDDAAVATDAEKNYLTGMVNTYLSRLGSGWAIWVNAIRTASPEYPAASRSHFPDPLTKMIDEERRVMFEQDNAHFETEYALVVQYLPPLQRESKIKDLLYTDDTKATTSLADRLLAEFKKKLLDLEDGLGGLLHMRRMKTTYVSCPGEDNIASDELVNHLHHCLTGEYLALRIPSNPMYLDTWLGYCEMYVGDTPTLNDKFISCIAIEDFPNHSFPGILDLLEGLPLEYRWSSRFIFVDQQEAIRTLDKHRKKWQQRTRGFLTQVFKLPNGQINTDALSMAEDSAAAVNEARSGLVAYGYYTPVVVLMHKDRQVLEENARFIKREIERRHFSARIETVNCFSAWWGSLPGQTYPNVRRPLINTLNFADMLPLSSFWPGLKENPCDFYPPQSPALMQAVTTGATPFRLNIHVGDVGHTLIFGPTGAGKSTLLATLLAQARRYQSRKREDGSTIPMTITAFDKGRSLYALCTGIGGAHYDIGVENGITLAPLHDLDSDSDVLWAEEWLATCFELQTSYAPSPSQREKIHRAVTLFRNKPREQRLLSILVQNIQDEEVKQALYFYTVKGSAGGLLDGETDNVVSSAFTVFEMDELMHLGDKTAIPVLLVLFRRFEKSLKGQPALLSLDEAWVMLGHRVFREKIREWLKELRKKNCAVLLATQSLSDAVNSGLLDVLLEQCPTKILLPNSEADLHGTKENPGPADLYKIFGLNDKEIQLLKRSLYKRQYYYKSPQGRRLFELGLGPVALSFVAVSDKESLAEIYRLQEQDFVNWPLRWLERRSVNYERYI